MRSVRLAAQVVVCCFMSSAFAAGFGFISNTPVQVDTTGYRLTGVYYQIQSKPYDIYVNHGDFSQSFKDALCNQFRFSKARVVDSVDGNNKQISAVLLGSDLSVTNVYDNTVFTGTQLVFVTDMICEL